MITTGERIGELAKARGINLHKLANMAGVSYNTLYSIVHRKSNKIDWDVAQKIATALNVSAETLFGVLDDLPLDEEENPIGAAMQYMAAIKNTRYAHAIAFSSTREGCNIINAFRLLNPKGRAEAAKRVLELAAVEEYQLTETTETPSTASLAESSAPADNPSEGPDQP